MFNHIIEKYLEVNRVLWDKYPFSLADQYKMDFQEGTGEIYKNEKLMYTLEFILIGIEFNYEKNRFWSWPWNPELPMLYEQGEKIRPIMTTLERMGLSYVMEDEFKFLSKTDGEIISALALHELGGIGCLSQNQTINGLECKMHMLVKDVQIHNQSVFEK